MKKRTMRRYILQIRNKSDQILPEGENLRPSWLSYFENYFVSNASPPPPGKLFWLMGPCSLLIWRTTSFFLFKLLIVVLNIYLFILSVLKVFT